MIRGAQTAGWGARFIALGLYIGMALAATWPLVTRGGDRLPVGTEIARTVPLLNAWIMWWNADRLWHGGDGYWDAPIFFPARNTLAMSEPQPTTMLVAPVYWMSGSRTLPYNVYLWISLVMNGCFAQYYLRVAGIRTWIAVGGGVAMILLPLVHWQIGVVQLVPLWGILWTWTAFLKIAKLRVPETRPRDVLLRGGELGLAFAMAFLTCVHHGLFLGLLMILSGCVLGRRLMAASTIGMLAIGVGLAAALTAPAVYHLHLMATTYDFSRPRETVLQLSAHLTDYTAAYGHSLLPDGWKVAGRDWWLSPGWLKMAMMIVGVVGGMWIPWRRASVAFLTVNLLAALGLSLGAHLEIFGWRPWWWVAENVPGFAQVRSVFRFAYFVQIAVVLLAAEGFDFLWSQFQGDARRSGDEGDGAPSSGSDVPSRARRGGRFVAGAILVALAGVMAVDPWPHRLRMGVVPDARRHQGWTGFLRASAAEGDGALCLPMAVGDAVGDYQISAEWMILGTYHGVPLANGYSGFFPPDYFALQAAVMGDGMQVGTVRRMFDEGIRWIVIDRRRFDVPWEEAWLLGPLTAIRVYQDPIGMDVYELREQG